MGIGGGGGGATKKSITFYFSICFFHFIIVLGLKGKKIYEEPPKIPSNFFFQNNYKNL